MNKKTMIMIATTAAIAAATVAVLNRNAKTRAILNGNGQ